MQMHSPYGEPQLVGPDAFMLDGISQQIAMPQQTLYSPTWTSHASQPRGHHGGSPMRVSKPVSAINSPRSSMQSRRRTIINDGLLARRNQQLLEQACLPVAPVQTTTTMADSMRRAARPVSWHPSSQHAAQILAQQQQQQQQQHYFPQQVQPAMAMSQFPLASYSNEVDMYTQYQQQYPPTPATYSSYGSPNRFSPLALPYSAFEPSQYATKDMWAAHAPVAASTTVSPDSECPGLLESTATTTNHGFFSQGCTPPTPDAYPSVPAAPEPIIPCDDAIPYHSLEQDEDEGEILVGMGLYDPPEKPLDDSAALDSYRSSVASLFGGSFSTPEPKGKGLKLEETWVPPPKEEEEEEEEEEGDESNSE